MAHLKAEVIGPEHPPRDHTTVCRLCKNLTTVKEFIRTNNRILHSSAQQGCSYCSLLYSASQGFYNIQDANHINVLIRTGASRMPMILQWEDETGNLPSLELYSVEGMLSFMPHN